MEDIKIIGIKCSVDNMAIVMKFMECLEYELIEKLPCPVPKNLKFETEDGKCICWYHGESPHIKTDDYLFWSEKEKIGNYDETKCELYYVSDMFNDLIGNTEIYYLYCVLDYYLYDVNNTWENEWKEKIYVRNNIEHIFLHNHIDGDMELTNRHMFSTAYTKLYDSICKNAESKGYNDVLTIISHEFNRNIKDLFNGKYLQHNYEGEGIFIPSDYTYNHRHFINKSFLRDYKIKRIKVDFDNQFYCDINGVLFSKDRKTLIRMPSEFEGKYIIPDGTEVISRYAFENSMIKEIVIPSTVKKIECKAFYNCCIRSVTIPEGITEIEDSTFCTCEYLTEVILPKSLKVIGYCSFSECIMLKEINIPDGVILIDIGAFQHCQKLIKINIPPQAKIEDYSFHQTAFIENYKDDFVIINNMLYLYKGKDENVTIPYNVTSIGYRAFHKNYNLFSVTIPETVTEIKDYAFDECLNLTVINIPESVTKIGSNCFLNTAWQHNYKNDFIIINGILHQYNGEEKNIIVPDTVNIIGEMAFSDNPHIESVHLPTSVRCIENLAFLSCINLSEINISDNIEYISPNAFNKCITLDKMIKKGKNKNIFARVFLEKKLMEIADTNKQISISLDNISELNDEEYLRLYSWLMKLIVWDEYTKEYGGVNYLMLLHEIDSKRFERCFMDAFKKAFISFDNDYFYDEFDKLRHILAVTDIDVYKQLLKLGCQKIGCKILDCSKIECQLINNEIVEKSKNHLKTLEISDEEYRKYWIAEYADFKNLVKTELLHRH